MTSGTSVTDFFETYRGEEACLHKIFETRWGDHTACPVCGKIGGWKSIPRTRKYRHTCRTHLSVLKGTAFYRSNLPLMAYFYAILLFANSSSGMRSTFIRKHLGLGLKGAVNLSQRVRLHISAYDRPERLGGPGKTVFVDEVYLRHIVDKGQGRRVSVQVLGFSCEGRVIAGIVPDRKAATLLAEIKKRVVPGSSIITDDWCGYKRVPTLGFRHIAVNHSKGSFFDTRGNSTGEIDSYWATVRRALRLYHQVRDDTLWLFLAEIEFRYNHRFGHCSPFETLVSHWPDLDLIGPEALRKRYDWREGPA